MRPRVAAPNPIGREEGRSATMWVIILEALVALGLLLLIVWLTMSPSRRRDQGAPPRSDADPDSGDKR